LARSAVIAAFSLATTLVAPATLSVSAPSAVSCLYVSSSVTAAAAT